MRPKAGPSRPMPPASRRPCLINLLPTVAQGLLGRGALLFIHDACLPQRSQEIQRSPPTLRLGPLEQLLEFPRRNHTRLLVLIHHILLVWDRVIVVVRRLLQAIGG